MKTLTKHFATLKQAERYQAGLYNKYNRVALISSPLFQEQGFYTWKVSK